MAEKILVTGANGFVGRALCAELARRGHEVVAAVRDARHAAGLPGRTVEVGTLRPDTDWSAALEGVDVVVHLAARVHVMKENASDPLAAFRALNVAATQRLADAAAAARVKRFVYVSSIKVNGESTHELPFTEADRADPQDPYGLSKWEAEQALWMIARAGSLELTIVRPPLVYGPGVGGNFLRLMHWVQRGIPLPLGSIKNRRSMIYNDNLASALVACATHPAAAGHTFLVSDGMELSTPDLIRRLGEGMGVPARLLPVPAGLLTMGATLARKAAEVDRLTGSLVIDGSGIRTVLGWSPPFSVDEGLKATARWFASMR
ncbi:MAG: NAD-dependent dehydratase [Betaproteobacteria bacterium]|nr:NAD-dependent dehydratase [Betaproteobacteria bacterium]